MISDRLGFGRCAFAKDFGRTGMQRLAAAFEQAVVGRILDQCVLKAVSPLGNDYERRNSGIPRQRE
jgi:hypothetical protein